MLGSDAIMDQLYSYTPSMNPLEAMAHGIICIGGGEPENYEIINETTLRPIINVLPTYESCFAELTRLVNNLSLIPQLRRDSYAYVSKHHDYIKVARQYEEFYRGLLREKEYQPYWANKANWANNYQANKPYWANNNWANQPNKANNNQANKAYQPNNLNKKGEA